MTPNPRESRLGAWCAFAYGVAAYAAGVAALLYLIAFCADLSVPRTVDAGPSAPGPLAVATDLLLLAAFGLQHSLMARQGFKRRWVRLVPAAVERSTYVFATGCALALLFAGWRPIPEPVVWRLAPGPATTLTWALFGAGWVLLLASTFMIDHFELFGLRQVFARLTGRAMPPARFRAPLLYRHVRHPIYLGLLLGFWATPVMTAGHLLFAAGATVYIAVGVAFEERDLVAQFGERYRRYREEVGMLLPRVLRR